MYQGKFKIYDEKEKKLLNGTGYSITGDGEVQTFNRDGIPEGTINNRHLRPIFSSGKKDVSGREIYEGFIVDRLGQIPGDEEITGIVIFTEGAWWIENRQEQRAVPLFSETAIDRVIGDIYSKGEAINV